MVKEKYKKLGDAALSFLPGGQYYVAKKKGKSEEELKWFKRLEYSRAAILAETVAAALMGDYVQTALDLGSYVAVSLPANVEKAGKDEYELEKEKLASEKGSLGKIRRGLHEAKTRLRDAVSDPEVATYLAASYVPHNLAGLGGEKMLYATTPAIDNLTHFAGGFSYSKLADKFYERGGVADYVKEKLEKTADRIKNKTAKRVLKKLSEHPKEVLGIATVGALGLGMEGFEKAGDTLAKSAGNKAFFGETVYNKTKDIFMDLAGSLTYYYSKNKKHAEDK